MKGIISYPCPNISLSMLVKEALDAAGSNEEQLEPLTDDVMNMTCVDLHHENWIALWHMSPKNTTKGSSKHATY